MDGGVSEDAVTGASQAPTEVAHAPTGVGRGSAEVAQASTGVSRGSAEVGQAPTVIEQASADVGRAPTAVERASTGVGQAPIGAGRAFAGVGGADAGVGRVSAGEVDRGAGRWLPVSRLQDFYELPEVPTDAGPFRVRQMSRVLGGVLDGATRPLRIVDVGCGDGEATERLAAVAHAKNAGHTVTGSDWAHGPLLRAQTRGLTVFRGTLAPPGLPIASGSVDVVVLNEVIEHLVDTDAAVAELHRVLRPGGHLLLSTPNLAAWFNRGALLLGMQPVFSEVSLRRVFGRPGSVVAGHLHLFTRRALVQFLDANGFTGITVSGACYHDTPGPLRPVDRALRHVPSLAAILICAARKPR